MGWNIALVRKMGVLAQQSQKGQDTIPWPRISAGEGWAGVSEQRFAVEGSATIKDKRGNWLSGLKRSS